MRLIIAGDQPSSRKAISLLVRTRLGIEVAGEAGSIDELMELVGADTSDLILLDIRLPAENLSELIGTLHELNYSPSVIVLHGQPEMKEASMAASADAFVHKASYPKQLLIAIEKVRIERRQRYKK